VKKTVVITMGDPTGIGPEITFKALTKLKTTQNNHLIVIGPLSLFKTQEKYKRLSKNKSITFHDIPLPASYHKKISKQLAGKISLDALRVAVKMIKNNQAQALVTAPISKENVRLAGFKFTGHTEFLCHEFGTKKHAMMLFNKRLRVVLSTIHIPLKDVIPSLSQKMLVEKLGLTADALRFFFKTKAPKIAVCGINPHAGENSLLGKEEKQILVPAINKFLKSCRQTSKVFGPVSADAVFSRAIDGSYDAVLCHYHDQGLIPIKLLGVDDCVNLTLGLPFVRTSPGHGTAFDIAGKDKASPNSMIAAIKAAIDSPATYRATSK